MNRKRPAMSLLIALRADVFGFGAGVLLGTLGQVATNVVLALSIKYLMDGIQLGSWDHLRLSWALLVTAVAVAPAVSSLSRYLLGAASSRSTARRREAVFDLAMRLSMDYYESGRSRELGSLLVNDLSVLAEGLNSHVPQLASSVIGLLVSAWILVSWSPQVAGVAAVLSVLSFLLNAKFRTQLKRISTDEQARAASMMAEMKSLSSSLEDVKALRIEGLYASRLDALVADHERAVKERARVQGKSTGISMATGNAFHPAARLVGGLLSFAGAMTLGSVEGSAQLSSQLVSPAGKIGQSVTEIQRGMAALNRTDEVLEMCPEDQLWDVPAGGVWPGPQEPGWAVEYSEVYFERGPDEPILEGFSLRIPTGSVVALVGPSGCGKTTAMRLAVGLYRQYRGIIRVAGTDIRNVDLRSLRERISFCPQELGLFRGTISENLALVKSGWETDPRSKLVAEALRLSEMVETLPQGWDTQVLDLSGGQRQRVAIVRSFLKEADVYFLDEPTSHLDPTSHEIVSGALREIAAGKAVFVTSHRVTDLGWVDSIVVMDRGRAVEQGDFQCLIDRNGLFRRLYDADQGDGRQMIH